MLERFDWMGRTQRRGTLLALGLAAVTALAACSDPEPSTGKNEGSASDADEGDDEEVKPVKDAGKTKDASKAVDAGPPEEETPAEGDAGFVTANSEWCKAKAVLDAKCVACHDGESTGPMPLLTVDDMMAEAPKTEGKKVWEVVGTRIHDSEDPMPPKGVLPAAELAALDGFLKGDKMVVDKGICDGDKGTTGDAGMETGGPDENGWDPTACDETYKIFAHGATLDDPATVAPGAEVHPQVYWDAPWGNEKVQMINSRPITDNKKVLHHWILYSGQGAFLTGWAPGDDERGEMPADIGMNMPTGARGLRLDMHYFNTEGTQTEKDKSGVELCIVKGEHLRPKAAAVTMSFTSLGPVLAPAGAKDKPITGTCNVTTTSPVTLMTASPHAHTYATHMKFTVKKKNGTEIVMHDGAFKFGEQQSYNLDPGVVIETGDTVYTTCSYTNNSTKNITFGESTTNEMCFNFASYWPAGALSCGFSFPGFN
jgi:hypothetical protein